MCLFNHNYLQEEAWTFSPFPGVGNRLGAEYDNITETRENREKSCRNDAASSGSCLQNMWR